MSQSVSRPAVSGRPRLFSVSVPQLRIEHLWLLLPAILVTWISFMHPLPTLDFWWHLKIGEIVSTTGEIPRVDLFSFTQAGQPFIHQNWLGEVFYYLTYRAGGFPLLIAFNTALLLLALIPILHLCLETKSRLRVAVLTALIAALGLGAFSNMRPQAYSIALFAVFYWVLWSYRTGRRDYLWTLPALMVVWVNLHGAFVLGIAVLGIVLVAETARRMLRGPRSDTLDAPALRKLAIVLILTGLAALLNPETYRVFEYVRQLQVDPSSQLFVLEWQVPDIKQLGDILVFFGPFFLSLVVFLYSRRRLDLTELGLFLAFAALALAAIRSGIWFALIATPMLARHVADLEIPDLWDEMREHPFFGSLVRRLESRQRKQYPVRSRLNWSILVLLILFTVLLSPWVRPHVTEAEALRPWLIDRTIPVEAVDYVAEHDLQGHIFHPQVYGDYLIWRLWPEQRSFFDGRVHLYDEDFVHNYILTLHDDDWEDRIAEYDIRYLLLPAEDEQFETMVTDARASGNWKLLYEDAVAVLFERR